MTDKLLIDRAVVEQALKALERADRIAGYKNNWSETVALRAALEQPQDHSEQRLDMVPQGWKLVPVEPTEKMVDMGRGLSSFPNGVYRAMLSAAPQPPTTEDSSVVEQPRGGQEPDWQDMYQKEKRRAEMWTAKYEQDIGKLEVAVPVVGQPQVEQEPVAVVTGFYGGFPTIRPLEPATVLPAGMALYANPQPPRQPLTDDQIAELMMEAWGCASIAPRHAPAFARAVEAAHGIKERK